MRSDVVIVGGGIIGAAVAWNLRRSGMGVTLVDRGEFGAATTASSYAWMNASSKVRLGYPIDYAEFSVRAALEPYLLADDIPTGWLHPTGNLELVAAGNAARLARDVDTLLHLGYPVVRLDHEQLKRRHPRLTLDAGTVGAWYPTEGWIDGQALVTDIVDLIDCETVELVHDDVVGFDVDHRAGAIDAVRLGSGRVIAARTVVITAGPWTADLAALAGIEVPMRVRTDAEVPGLVVRITAPESGLDHPIMGDGFLVRPHHEGEAVLSGDAHGARLSTAMSHAEVTRAGQRLLDLAAETLPALRDCSIIDAGVGVRALTGDGNPIADRCPGLPNLYVVVTHSGISLAPAIGRLVAREIQNAGREAELEPFRLTRFAPRPHQMAGGQP